MRSDRTYVDDLIIAKSGPEFRCDKIKVQTFIRILTHSTLVTIRKQIASEIVNKKQFALWLKSTKIFRTRVEKLKRQNRSLKTKNNIFKTYLNDLKMNTKKLTRLTKKKRATKSKKSKKIIVRVENHDFLSSKTKNFETILNN